MSDLQCPAVIVLLTPETIDAQALAGRRLAGVVAASALDADSRAILEAGRLAAEHGCQLDRADLADGGALVRQIEDLADLYRGEMVAVVAATSAVRDALEWADAPRVPIAIAVDGTGRTLIQA